MSHSFIHSFSLLSDVTWRVPGHIFFR